MVQKYYNVQEVAEILGVSVDEVKQMLGSRELHGYRDGADWKFKVEDIEAVARQRDAQPSAAGEEGEGDVLASEVELGESDPGASGTVIGMEGDGKAAAESDLQLLDSDLALDAMGESSGAGGQDDVDSKVVQFEELDLTLEEDVSLEDSEVGAGESSDVDLAGEGLDDDDLVLGGGSGAGSDVTIGSDSGISLVDPADSGLSLEEPLELSGGSQESLELGEDDMLTLNEDAQAEAPEDLETDDDFLLTPLEEGGDEDDSESGSQVIALDAEEGEEADIGMLDGTDGAAAPPTVDEAALGVAPLAIQPDAVAAAATGPQSVAAGLPEAPYTVWNVVGLALCAIMLMFCGMMTYDLLRNMWSWDTPYSVNSSVMDLILGLFE